MDSAETRPCSRCGNPHDRPISAGICLACSTEITFENATKAAEKARRAEVAVRDWETSGALTVFMISVTHKHGDCVFMDWTEDGVREQVASYCIEAGDSSTKLTEEIVEAGDTDAIIEAYFSEYEEFGEETIGDVVTVRMPLLVAAEK